MSFLNIALTFFIVANPIGNSPAIISLIKDFDLENQKKIMLREALLAFFLAIFFQYLGELFLSQLDIRDYTLQMCGGILLIIVALQMIFSPSDSPNTKTLKKEPLFVPIATPLISGPALLTIIMIYSRQEDNLKISLALALTWVAVTAILISAPYLKIILRRRGLIALEQLMGLVLSLMAVEMIVQGLTEFIKSVKII